MPFELIAHGVFSFVSGVSVAITGFGCDSARELFAELSTGPNAYPASSAINMGLSAALVTAVQAALQRRVIHGGLLLNTLPWTFIGVVLSLNVFSAAVLAALVPAVGACLLGLSLAKLWMELADRRHKASVRDGDDDGRRGANSWKWTGVLVVASIAGGLLSGRCPPPGPVFMVLLLASGEGVNVGGGEWRATAALVTCSSSLLRVGLLLLENGASAGPLSEVSVLVVGGLVGVAAGNFALRVLSSSGGDNGSEERRIPRPAAFRRCVLAVALTTSAAMAVGGPPAALASVSRPVVLGTLAVVCVVAAAGALWGCTRGAAGNGGARGVYGTVASDDRDVEVELKPFVAADGGPDSRGEDDDYLDEEDGYLADEGEVVEEEEQGVSGSRRVREQPRRGGDRRPPAAAAAVAVAVEVPSPRAKLSSPSRADGGALGGTGAGVAAHEGGKKEKKVKLAAPPAQSLFPAGHTMEL